MADKHIRFQQLKTVCNKALDESQKALTEANVLSCYPSLQGSHGKELLDTIRSNLIDSWGENTLNEFEAIFKERKVEQKLNELDDLIAEAERRDDSGVILSEMSTSDLLHSQLIPVKEKQVQQLKEQLEKLKSTNLSLLSDLQTQLDHVKAVRGEITEGIAKLKNLNAIVDENKLGDELSQLIEITRKEDIQINSV